MSTPHSRRRFLRTAGGAGALLGLDGLGVLGALPAVGAAEARLDPKLVRLDSGIEPLVRLLEETPRDRLLEEVAGRVRRGLAYRDVLAALLLAGVRNVRPRPHVGFKFHAVLVVNSAHLASLASPDAERWLPVFWALDYFKSAQAANLQESGWRMGPVDEARVPTARKARQAFVEAMDAWDEGAADAAAAGLARSAGSHEVFELFCRFGARDFRDIGHKAIFVANAWRTLQCIGWQHAEPVLRSLAYALLAHEGDSPAGRDDPADRPGRANRGRLARFRDAWHEGKSSPEAAADLLAVLRGASPEAACDKIVEAVNGGTVVQSVWDALLAGAGELTVRQPGIVALHAVTTTNALRYAFQTSGDDATRRWLLLQNAAFLPMFRDALASRGKVADGRIDRLEPVALESKGGDAVAEIFREVGRDRQAAARKVLAYRAAGGDPAALIDAARLLVFFKGNDAHDYKFSAAVLEDYARLSPEWRDRYLAASMFLLRGSGGPDSPVAKRAREALKKA